MRTIYLPLLLGIFLTSCVTSNQVSSSRLLQKRKYTKGWYFGSRSNLGKENKGETLENYPEETCRDTLVFKDGTRKVYSVRMSPKKKVVVYDCDKGKQEKINPKYLDHIKYASGRIWPDSLQDIIGGLLGYDTIHMRNTAVYHGRLGELKNEGNKPLLVELETKVKDTVPAYLPVEDIMRIEHANGQVSQLEERSNKRKIKRLRRIIVATNLMLLMLGSICVVLVVLSIVNLWFMLIAIPMIALFAFAIIKLRGPQSELLELRRSLKHKKKS